MTKSPFNCPLSQTLCNLSEVERFEETLGLSWEMNKSLKEALWLCTTTCWVSIYLTGCIWVLQDCWTSVHLYWVCLTKVFQRCSWITDLQETPVRWPLKKMSIWRVEMWQNDLCPCLCCVWLFCSGLHRQGAAWLAKQEAAAFTDAAERWPADLRGIWRPQLLVHQNKAARSHVSDS